MSARSSDKSKQELNLQRVEENIDMTDKELTKLRLFAKEVCTLNKLNLGFPI